MHYLGFCKNYTTLFCWIQERVVYIKCNFIYRVGRHIEPAFCKSSEQQ